MTITAQGMWPDPANQLTVHVAGDPDNAGTQRCTRCGHLIHEAGRSGAPPMWFPGQQVAVSDSGSVRMTVTHRPGVAYRSCDGAPVTE